MKDLSLGDLLRIARDAEGIIKGKDGRIAALEREVKFLRHYGNKTCTAMADEAMADGTPTP